MRVTVADPAGNITLFIEDLYLCTIEQVRALTTKAILSDPKFKNKKAEQAGLVFPPEDESEDGLWHLRMSGGEFCGNAARSFGLFVAKKLELDEKGSIKISISGAELPVLVRYDMTKNYASARIPPPVMRSFMEYKNQKLPVYIFKGITHVIACDIQCNKNSFDEIKNKFDALPELHDNCDALGVMFYNSEKKLMEPVVYVYKTDSLVFEKSCGSGSAAFACYSSEGIEKGKRKLRITQPGGIIETTIVKQEQAVKTIEIGGSVFFSGPYNHRYMRLM